MSEIRSIDPAAEDPEAGEDEHGGGSSLARIPGVTTIPVYSQQQQSSMWGIPPPFMDGGTWDRGRCALATVHVYVDLHARADPERARAISFSFWRLGSLSSHPFLPSFERRWAMVYLSLTAPVSLALPRTVRVATAMEYTVTSPSELFRYATSRRGCECATAQSDARGDEKCDRCCRRCTVRIVDREGNVDDAATEKLSSERVALEFLLGAKKDAFPPHFAPCVGFAESESTTELAEHGVPSHDRSQVYRARNEKAIHALADLRWWCRFNCGFAGCRARAYVGETWSGKLLVMETAVAHVHACDGCAKHKQAPCTAGCCAVAPASASPPRASGDEDDGGDASASVARAATIAANSIPGDLLPPVVPAAAEVAGGSPHAAWLHVTACEALAESRISTDPSAAHGWLVRHVAGRRRLVHGSYPTYVGASPKSVHNQQHRFQLVAPIARRTDASQKMRVMGVVDKLRKDLKDAGEHVFVTVIDDDDDFSVVVTTKYRCRLWLDLCAGGPDRDWKSQLIPSVDGTGNVASNLDGKVMFLNGVGVRSGASCVPGLPIPGPLLLVAFFTTGTTADAFAKCWTEFMRMVEKECGEPPAAPPAIMSDLDTVFLGPLSKQYTGYETYAEYKVFVWQQTVEAYRLMVTRAQVLASAVDQTPNAEKTESVGALLLTPAQLAEAKKVAVDHLRTQVDTWLLACTAHTMRDVGDYFYRNKEIATKLAKPRRALLLRLMRTIVRRVENSAMLRGIENLPHFLNLVKLLGDFFRMPESVAIGQTYLDGHLVVRVPSRDFDPTFFTADAGAEPRASTCGETQPVVAVAVFTYQCFEMTVPFFARHVISPGSNATGPHPDANVERPDSESVVMYEDDEEAKFASDAAGCAPPNCDAEAIPVDHAPDLDAAIRAVMVEPIRRSRRVRETQANLADSSAPSPPPPPTTRDTSAVILRTRWVVKGNKAGTYPLAEILERRAPRMLLSSPLVRSDLFPALQFGGNTSTTVELCWRELKHRGPTNLPGPPCEILAPFVDWFVSDEYRFDSATAALTGKTPTRSLESTRQRQVTDAKAKVTALERALEEATARTRRLQAETLSHAVPATLVTEREPANANETSPREAFPRDEIAHRVELTVDDTLLRIDSSARELTAERRHTSQWGTGAAPRDPPRKPSDADGGDATESAPARRTATATDGYAKTQCDVCVAQVETGSRIEGAVYPTTKSCPNGLCPRHCKRFSLLAQNPEHEADWMTGRTFRACSCVSHERKEGDRCESPPPRKIRK